MRTSPKTPRLQNLRSATVTKRPQRRQPLNVAAVFRNTVFGSNIVASTGNATAAQHAAVCGSRATSSSRRHQTTLARGEARRGEDVTNQSLLGVFNYRTTQQPAISTTLTLCESYVIRGISVCLHAFTRQSGGRSLRIFNRRRVSCSCHLPPSAVGGSHRLYSSRVASPRRKPHVCCSRVSCCVTPLELCRFFFTGPKWDSFSAQSLVAVASASYDACRYSMRWLTLKLQRNVLINVGASMNQTTTRQCRTHLI